MVDDAKTAFVKSRRLDWLKRKASKHVSMKDALAQWLDQYWLLRNVLVHWQ
jgi:hypothetical protein